MRRSFIKYIFALLLFGSNGVVASCISMPSDAIVWFRTVVGACVLAAVFFAGGRRCTAHRHRRDTLFIACSGAAMALDWLLLFEAYQQIGVSLGMLINYSGPIIVILLSIFLLHEAPTRRKVTAILLAMLGVVCICGQAAVRGVNIFGLVCAVLSAMAYAAMVLFNKMANHVSGLENAFLQLSFAAVTVVLVVSIRGGLCWDLVGANLLPTIWISVVNTGFACYLYFSSIGQLPVATVAICGYIEPLSAVLFSAMILHESLLPLQLAGTAMIVFAVLIGENQFHLPKRNTR